MFDETNGYGNIPDALPASYGYADRQAPTVHQNQVTALSSNPFDAMGVNQMVVASNSASPSVQNIHGGMPAGPIRAREVNGIRGARPVMDVPHRAPPPQSAATRADFGAPPAFGASQGVRARPRDIPVLTDQARSLEYRVYDGQGGYRYFQYEDGRYAIARVGKGKSAKLPSNVKLGAPFGPSANKAAFEGIKDEVETAIGPFPGTASEPSIQIKPGSKKADAKKSSKGAEAPAAETSAGSGGGGFVQSGADTTEKLPSDDDKGEEKKNWFAQSTLGVPHWGWVAGAVVVSAGAGFYFYSQSKPKPTPPAGG